MFSPKKESKVISAVEAKKIAIAPAAHVPPKPLHITAINQLFAGFSEYKDAACLARTCRFLFHGTKDPLHTRKLKKLPHSIVVEANEDQVKAMLTGNPELINTVFPEIIDNSGRTLINNTIFQLAYGAGDDEMCLALKPFFIQVYGSEEAAIREMDRQRTQKFAEDKEDARKEKEAKDHLAALLHAVNAAITAEQFDQGRDADRKLILSPATLAAIETFRIEFAKSQPKRIEKGMHFRSNSLQETYDEYVRAAGQWGYDYNRCALFEDGVLSCVLQAAPANDAQRFSQGLYYIQNRGNKFSRCLNLRDTEINFYGACRAASSDFSALSGSCVNISYGGREPVVWLGGRPASLAIFSMTPAAIKTYVEQKRQTCRAYAICQAMPDVSVCNLLR